MKKILVSFFVLTMVILPALVVLTPMPAIAQTEIDDRMEEIETFTGLGSADPRIMAAQGINIILGFLGILAIIIILMGGFRWMTAGGNEDKVSEAKKTIGAGVIGLFIILASFGLAKFVIDALYIATGAPGAGG